MEWVDVKGRTVQTAGGKGRPLHSLRDMGVPHPSQGGCALSPHQEPIVQTKNEAGQVRARLWCQRSPSEPHVPHFRFCCLVLPTQGLRPDQDSSWSPLVHPDSQHGALCAAATPPRLQGQALGLGAPDPDGMQLPGTQVGAWEMGLAGGALEEERPGGKRLHRERGGGSKGETWGVLPSHRPAPAQPRQHGPGGSSASRLLCPACWRPMLARSRARSGASPPGDSSSPRRSWAPDLSALRPPLGLKL